MDFTPDEKNLILQALNHLFRTGVKGEMAVIETTLMLARSIERKLTADQAIAEAEGE